VERVNGKSSQVKFDRSYQETAGVAFTQTINFTLRHPIQCLAMASVRASPN